MTKFFKIFDDWFNIYLNYYSQYVIFNPGFFNKIDLETTLKVYNFAFVNQIKILVETIAYSLIAKITNIITNNDNYFIISDVINENENSVGLIKIDAVLVGKILNYMPIGQYHNQSKKVKQLINYPYSFKYKNKLRLLKFMAIAVKEEKYPFENIIHYNDYNIYAMYMPEDLTSINLQTIDIIRENTFRKCHNLKTIKLPRCRIIKKGSFAECESLMELEIPKNTKLNHTFDSYKNIKITEL